MRSSSISKCICSNLFHIRKTLLSQIESKSGFDTSVFIGVNTLGVHLFIYEKESPFKSFFWVELCDDGGCDLNHMIT